MCDTSFSSVGCKHKIIQIKRQLEGLSYTQGRTVSIVIIKKILNWKTQQDNGMSELWMLSEESIVVCDEVLPGLVFSAFWVLVNVLPLFCICEE